MIIYADKKFETNILFPTGNFSSTPEKVVFIIDETTEEGNRMAKLVHKYYPYYDFVIVDGLLNDIIPLPISPDPNEYKRLRAAEYLPIGDQLDAILKHLRGTESPDSDLAKIIELWLEVKAKYPKPGE
ncbi:MAG: hypothetical protein WA118_08340 [Carboxydocellales bacterium]